MRQPESAVTQHRDEEKQLAADEPVHPSRLAMTQHGDPVEFTRAGRGDILPTMDLLLDVELPVSVSFGKTEIPIKDVLKLTIGSIVELNRNVNEPVEVMVNHCLIARGEVVVVEGNYGVRIQQIISRSDRLRSVR